MKACPSCSSLYPLDYTACPKDQTPLMLATELAPGMVLRGKYEILAKLGEGGMGAVYKARHLAFGELRAIKFVSGQLLADERALARFRSEAVVARRLQHPNAVKVEDLDTAEDGRPFIVMEFVLGRSLRELLFSEGEVSTKRILALARQACGALAAAHSLGIVHRDIKPDNLMVLTGAGGEETLKVADFGLAKVLEGFELAPEKKITQTGFFLGTPPYMSPEQASGLEVDARSDLYSFGVVLYEMFTGRLPFRSDTPLGMLIHHRETPPPSPAALGVPQPLAAFLLKSLAKRREDRFQTAEQMDEGLRQLSLLSLPEFVGQGIRDGFDPQWAGSRHASRMTTVRASPAPLKTTIPERAGGPRSAGRSPVPPGPRSTPASPPVEAEDQPSSSRFWLGIGAVLLVSAWFVTTRQAPAPVSAPTPVVPPSSEVAPVAAAQSEPETAREAERTDDGIRVDIERLLNDSSALRAARIRVDVANGVVTLSGEAPSETTAELAASLAASVQGARQVFSTLETGVQSASSEARPAPAAAAAESAPTRAPGPPQEDATREQVRVLLDRAREKMEARNPEAARADFEAVLRLDPNNFIAKDALERIRNRPLGPPGRPGPGPRPTP